MSHHRHSFPSDPDVLSVFRQELGRTASRHGLVDAGPVLWPRFVGYYEALARLPRRLRRALQRRWRRSLGGLALLLALGQAPALAATINVNGVICTVIDAITAANNDKPTGGCPGGSGADTITLPAGSIHTLTSVNNTTYGPTGLPLVTTAITIEGNGSTITRDGTAPAFRILAIGTGGDLTLQETTITGGISSGGGLSGGGVENLGTLTLTQSTVSGNSADRYGGGLRNAGTLTLTHSTVSGNSAPFGGGVYSTGTATLTHSTVSGNSAAGGCCGGRGGGILTLGGTLTLTNSTVSGNSTDGQGGGLSHAGATLSLTNSTVSGNSAGSYGGGIRNVSTLTLTHSTVSGNSAGGAGGGVFNYVYPPLSALTFVQTLVSGNLASSQGPEVYHRRYVEASEEGIYADAFNLFGHDSVAGIDGFTPGPTDLVPSLDFHGQPIA